jgi:hypothetical protein
MGCVFTSFKNTHAQPIAPTQTKSPAFLRGFLVRGLLLHTASGEKLIPLKVAVICAVDNRQLVGNLF